MRWFFIATVALNLFYLGVTFVAREQVERVVADGTHLATYPKTLHFLEGELSDPNAPVGANYGNPGCLAVGPIYSQDSAEELVDRLGGAGYQATTREINSSTITMYWVYIPPLGGRAQALRRLREMHVAGIDSYVVSGGSDQHAISLGLFAVRDSALGVQARLRAAGYPVQVREQARRASAYWIVLNGAASGFVEFLPEEYRGRSLTYQACVGD